MTIHAISFDLDGTLINDNAARSLTIDRTAEELSSAYPAFDFKYLAATYERVSRAYWPSIEADVQRGTISGDEWRREAWRLTLLEFGCDENAVADRALTAYSQHRSHICIPHQDTTAMLAMLPDNLYLAIITNAPKGTQREKLRATDLIDAFDDIVISGEVGVAKPDPAIFQLALKKAGVAPEEAIHVGVSLQADIAGALNAGMTAVWLNRHGKQREDGQPTPHHEIASLSELRRLLDNG